MGAKTILDLEHDDARAFLLESESYCSMDLPPYIQFGNVIAGVHRALTGTTLNCMRKGNPRDYDDVNYTILNNKDGKYAWRPLQLIHPALYVSLVHSLTEKGHWDLIRCRLKKYRSNDNIRCLSLPVQSSSEKKDKAEQVSHWWQEVEQRSIELSLDYAYLIETDITDCYGSIYTHTIAWALHGKRESKANRKDGTLIGNIIDWHLQDMRHGQTNGIPQGSVLMDFIAEIVLGYADCLVSERIANESTIQDYKVLRYRDDYRVFVNNPQDGEAIVKMVTEILTELGMKLNSAKTTVGTDVVSASIKSDKLSWIGRRQSDKRLQKHLLIIHRHAADFPNAGSLVGALNGFNQRLLRTEQLGEGALPLIAIVVDIAYHNPKTYPICAAILSKLLTFIPESEKVSVVERIQAKFKRIPNTGYMQIWMQRVTLPLDMASGFEYDEPICKVLAGDNQQLWNRAWISSRALNAALNAKKIIDSKALSQITPVISPEEVELFVSKGGGGGYG